MLPPVCPRSGRAPRCPGGLLNVHGCSTRSCRWREVESPRWLRRGSSCTHDRASLRPRRRHHRHFHTSRRSLLLRRAIGPRRYFPGCGQLPCCPVRRRSWPLQPATERVGSWTRARRGGRPRLDLRGRAVSCRMRSPRCCRAGAATVGHRDRRAARRRDAAPRRHRRCRRPRVAGGASRGRRVPPARRPSRSCRAHQTLGRGRGEPSQVAKATPSAYLRPPHHRRPRPIDVHSDDFVRRLLIRMRALAQEEPVPRRGSLR